MEDGALGVTIGQSEELIEKFTRAAKRGTSLPVLAKLTPNITDMVPMALAARRGGADGIAAINTINSITGVNIDTLVAEPAVHGKSIIGGYSGAAVKPIALRFISDLANCDELKEMHISGMGGIETWRDALEFILLGSGSVQITTAVMQYGYRIIDDLIEGLTAYMKAKGIPTLYHLIGGASETIVSHQSIERDTILFPIFVHERCNGCGRCYISCMDGGHQAITLDPETRMPKLDGSKCVGCHLCRLVCASKAIAISSKTIRRQNNA
jgi:dihydropyrimidine dehydrogenase (NAD+) subunit PreA